MPSSLAMASASAPSVVAGPPMTSSEKEEFRAVIYPGWNVDTPNDLLPSENDLKGRYLS